MKIEDVAYQIAGETLHLLETKYHYHITEEHKKDIQSTIRANTNKIISSVKDGK